MESLKCVLDGVEEELKGASRRNKRKGHNWPADSLQAGI